MARPLAADEHKPRFGGPSFSKVTRVERLVWMVTWLLLARWTPPSFWRWRRFILGLFGATLAGRCDVRGSAAVWLPRNLSLGMNALIAERVNCYNQAPISLGDEALVSQGAYLCAGTHDIDDLNFQLVTRPIRIDDQAWVAADAFVGPGAHIRKGSVLGARAVCFASTQEWGVYIGNPARFVRTRKHPSAGA